MERSYESVREGVIGIANRWARASRALKEEDRPYGEKLVHYAKMYSCGSFFGCDDPLEAVLFSVLLGIIKCQEDHGSRAEIPEDEHPEEGVLSLKYWT